MRTRDVLGLVLAAVSAVFATVVVAGLSMVWAACAVADDQRWDTTTRINGEEPA